MKRKTVEKVITNIMYIGFCGVAGVFGGHAMTKLLPKDAPVWLEFVGLFGVILTFFITVIIQTFIHEMGHMVCGLISGYEFNSFRIFNIMIVKENGKLVRKKFSIAGTGGQCIMTPPGTDGTSPVALYNWGGCIVSAFASIVSIAVSIFCWEKVILSTFLLIFGIIGIYLAIINGVPLKSLSNDGYNAVTLKKRLQTRIAFERSLIITKELLMGKRLKDMPSEYFDYEIGKYELDDTILISAAGMTINYHIDCGNYDKVYELSKYLYDNVELIDLHKFVAMAELITSILVTGRDKSMVESILNKENKKLLKIHEAQPSTHRVWYVYELLYNKDEEKANKHREDFDKLAEKYPYKVDLQNDIELMEYALKKYEKCKLA